MLQDCGGSGVQNFWVDHMSWGSGAIRQDLIEDIRELGLVFLT